MAADTSPTKQIEDNIISYDPGTFFNIVNTDVGENNTTTTPASDSVRFNTMAGKPYSYLNTTDPLKRSYARHMLSHAPILFIRPGDLRFSQTDMISKLVDDTGLNEDQVKEALGLSKPNGNSWNDYYKFKSADEAKDEESAKMRELLDKKIKREGKADEKLPAGISIDNAKASRYYDFEPNLAKFYSIYSTLSGRIYSRMKGSAMGWYDVLSGELTGSDASASILKNHHGGFITFWANSASSVSESASNEVGETITNSMIKKTSGAINEFKFVLGNDLSNVAGANAGSDSQGFLNSVIGAISGVLGADNTKSDFNGKGSVTKITNVIGSAIMGHNPLFPEIWKDSTFRRSYNISFKLNSPYGSPLAIYQDVISPFLLLLSMSIPLAQGTNSYSSPLLIQLDCPGYFSCDCGIITDITFTKGGQENLWTLSGLPRQIDVNLTVVDLYPTLMASQNIKSLILNAGLGTFLDNLAGLDLFSSISQTNDWLVSLKTKINILSQGIGLLDNYIIGEIQTYLSTTFPFIYNLFIADSTSNVTTPVQ